MEPPWVPKPDVVYAKNMDKFRDTSEDEDVTFDAKDEKFFQLFSTGAVPVTWQQEMIDSGLFDQLNDAKLNSNGSVWTSSMCIIL